MQLKKYKRNHDDEGMYNICIDNREICQYIKYFVDVYNGCVVFDSKLL